MADPNALDTRQPQAPARRVSAKESGSVEKRKRQQRTHACRLNRIDPLAARTVTVSDYHINIFYSAEDAAYVADIPDLASCSAVGATPEQALAAVEIAKEAWLVTAREAGRPIPVPRYRPAIYQTVK